MSDIEQVVAKAIRSEPHLATIRDILAVVPAPIVIELGANNGYHTRILRHFAGKLARYFAFEPDPRNVEIFLRSGLQELVTFVPGAVGDKSGEIPFYMATPEPNGAVGSSSISPFLPSLTESWAWLRCQGTIPVASYRIDDFMASNGIARLDFLWMDVQGAERLVFEGCGARARDIHRIYTEFGGGYEHSTPIDDLVAQLNGLGGAWRIHTKYPGDALLVNDAFDAVP